MLMPKQEVLEDQINDDNENKKYQCMECRKTFSPSEIKVEKMPDNFTVSGAGNNIPKCPHCGYLHFFGFKEV